MKKPLENRQSFMKRLFLKVSRRDLHKIELAYRLAKEAHRFQFRDDMTRYFEHLRGVDLILIDELGITDTELLIAGLLHDAPEDSFLLKTRDIKLIFGERVGEVVLKVTKPKLDRRRFKNKMGRNKWYFERIKKSSLDVKIIKLADRLHNLRTLWHCDVSKIKRKIKETEVYCLPLIEDIKGADQKRGEYLEKEFGIIIRGLKQRFNLRPDHC